MMVEPTLTNVLRFVIAQRDVSWWYDNMALLQGRNCRAGDLDRSVLGLGKIHFYI